MNSTAKALTLSFMERYTALILSIGSTMVLARILTPAETGLFSIGVALTALIAQFRDFGVTTFLIQEPDLTDEKFRTALGVSTITMLLLMAAILLGSGWAGDFYHEPGITQVMRISALSFVVIPFNSIVMVWLRRQMQFHTLYKMTVAGAVCHAVTGVALALLGFGYMSLAWATVANNAGSSLVAFHYRPRQYSYVPSFKAWRQIAAFGVYSTISNICQEAVLRSSDLFIGRSMGMNAVGEFSRANGLVAMINQSLLSGILPVALSVFALKRRAGEALGIAYLSGLSLLTAIAWPAFAFLGLMAFPLIRLLFGDQWDIAIDPARLIAAAGMVSCLTVLHPSVFQATGAMRQRMSVQLVIMPLKLLVFFISAQYGLAAVAAGTILNALIELVPSQFAVDRVIGTRPLELFATLWKSLLATAASAAGSILILIYLPPSVDYLWQPIILAALATGIFWLIAIFLLAHPLADEILRLIGQARGVLSVRFPLLRPSRK